MRAFFRIIWGVGAIGCGVFAYDLAFDQPSQFQLYMAAAFVLISGLQQAVACIYGSTD